MKVFVVERDVGSSGENHWSIRQEADSEDFSRDPETPVVETLYARLVQDAAGEVYDWTQYSDDPRDGDLIYIIDGVDVYVIVCFSAWPIQIRGPVSLRAPGTFDFDPTNGVDMDPQL